MKLYTLEEVATLLCLPKSQIEEYVQCGVLLGIRIGFEYRFSEIQIQQCLQTLSDFSKYDCWKGDWPHDMMRHIVWALERDFNGKMIDCLSKLFQHDGHDGREGAEPYRMEFSSLDHIRYNDALESLPSSLVSFQFSVSNSTEKAFVLLPPLLIQHFLKQGEVGEKHPFHHMEESQLVTGMDLPLNWSNLILTPMQRFLTSSLWGNVFETSLNYAFVGEISFRFEKMLPFVDMPKRLHPCFLTIMVRTQANDLNYVLLPCEAFQHYRDK